MEYDGMRQPIKLGEVGEHSILPCGVGLKQDSVAVQDLQDSSMITTATVEARLASLLCFSAAPGARVMSAQLHRFAYPISIPSFAQPCLASMSRSPANQIGNRNKEGETWCLRHTPFLNSTALSHIQKGPGAVDLGGGHGTKGGLTSTSHLAWRRRRIVCIDRHVRRKRTECRPVRSAVRWSAIVLHINVIIEGSYVIFSCLGPPCLALPWLLRQGAVKIPYVYCGGDRCRNPLLHPSRSSPLWSSPPTSNPAHPLSHPIPYLPGAPLPCLAYHTQTLQLQRRPDTAEEAEAIRMPRACAC